MIELVNKDKLSLLNVFLEQNGLQTISNFEYDNNPFMKLYVYKVDNNIIGYLNFSQMYENAELNQIFVKDDYRKLGIGSKLMAFFLSQCFNCSSISLEVRCSNVAAIKLYEKFGFIKATIRKNYYDNEDAFLMISNGGFKNG